MLYNQINLNIKGQTMKIFYKTLLILYTIFFFNGCTNSPTNLELVITSSSNLNPDIKNVSSPLMLTFYELESAENFLKYDYWTLMEDAGINLNRDLISQSKQIIVPLQKQTYKIEFDKDAKFLGVVGQFRNIDNNSSWKYLINLNQESNNFSELRIENFNIERVK